MCKILYDKNVYLKKKRKIEIIIDKHWLNEIRFHMIKHNNIIVGSDGIREDKWATEVEVSGPRLLHLPAKGGNVEPTDTVFPANLQGKIQRDGDTCPANRKKYGLSYWVALISRDPCGHFQYFY